MFDAVFVTETDGLDWKPLGLLGFTCGFETSFGIGFNNGVLLGKAEDEDL